MAENRQMKNKFQVARQPIKQLHVEVQKAASTQVYLEENKVVILGEVSTLGETMWSLYEELVTMHKTFFYLHDMQHK